MSWRFQRVHFVIFLMCVSGCAASLSAAPTTQPALPPHVLRLADIRYGDGPGKSNLLDIYLPEHLNHPLPLVVYVHGGGWSQGDKITCPGIWLVQHGFLVASINYRLSGQAPYPAQMHDCKGAIRFLRAHAAQYKIDPNEIGAWGASAGGHLVAVLGTSAGSKELEGSVGGNLAQSSRVQAVCDWYGPTDLSRFAQQAQAAGIIQMTPGPSLIMNLFGGSLEEKKDLVQLANPVLFVQRRQSSEFPPFLIMHGDKDPLVPMAQSQLLCNALTLAGASVDLQILHGAGHGRGFYTPAVMATIQKFFQSNLK